METYIVPMLLEHVRVIRPVRRSARGAAHGRSIDDSRHPEMRSRDETGVTAELERRVPPP
jgi:hypothetical protein